MKLSTIRIFCLLIFGISLTYTHSTNVGTFRLQPHKKADYRNSGPLPLERVNAEETSWKLTSTKGFYQLQS